MQATITSLKNPKIRYVVKLGKRSFRDAVRQTLVEGGRELDLALRSGIEPVQVFVCPPLLDDTTRQVADRCRDLALLGTTELYELSPEAFARIAYRGGTGGLLAVIPSVDRSLDEISVSERPFVLVVEGAEKPGNLGAILRSADAAGVDVVIACGGGTDVNNANTIRASMGAIFSVPVVETESDKAILWLQANHISIIAATPDATALYSSVDMTGPVAIAVGSEANGLGEAWLSTAHVRAKIPMAGKVDSLNLSASTAVLLFETVRQRLEYVGRP